MKPAKHEKFLTSLDKVVDLLSCKYLIQTCTEALCNGCSDNAHINCACSKANKIPTIELQFILAQRSKFGEKSSMQMASVDHVETNKINKRIEGQQAREAAHQERLTRNKEQLDIQSKIISFEHISEDIILDFF